MTSKEASEVLKASSIQQMSFCKVVVNEKAFNVREALDMAIKSLEAWDKVKVEMQEQYKTFANIASISDIWADAIEIVDKYLSEVNE